MDKSLQEISEKIMTQQSLNKRSKLNLENYDKFYIGNNYDQKEQSISCH